MNRRTWFLAGAALFAAAPAYAQTTSDPTAVEAVVITARKLAETVQETPVSAGVLSATQLEARGVDDMKGVAGQLAGLAFENYGGPFGTPVIRGQSQTRLTNPVQNVASFYNGVYLQKGYQVDASFLDLQRVEVLRGPQSAALGRNAFAGAVNFVTERPASTLTAKASASAGSDDYRKYVASLSGPLLGDKLTGRLAGTYGEYDGGWTNAHPLANAGGRTSGKLGGYETKAVLAALDVQPVEAFTLALTFSDSRREQEAAAGYTLSQSVLERYNSLNCSTVAGANKLYCGALPVMPALVAGEPRPEGLVIDPRSDGGETESQVFTAAADWKLSPSTTLSYLYGWTDASFIGGGASARNQTLGYTGLFAGLFGLAGSNLLDLSGNGGIEARSHELRLTHDGDGPLRGFVGVYASETDDLTLYRSQAVSAQTSGALTAPRSLSGVAFQADSTTTTKIQAVFGLVEADYPLWKASLELRQTHEEQTIADRYPAAASASTDFDYFTPRATVTWKIAPTSNLYLSAARGVKSGGFNVASASTLYDPSQATYAPETNTTIELGFKNLLVDRRLMVNAALYRIEAEDIQITEARRVAPPAAASATVTGNLGSTETTGFELETAFRASRAWTLHGSASYNDAQYGDGVISKALAASATTAYCDGLVCAANGAIGGKDLERSPRWTAHVGFDWQKSLAGGYTAYAHGTTSYVGAQYVDATNLARIAPRTVSDLSVGLTKGGLDLRLWSDNLFDEKYVSSAFLLLVTGGTTYIPILGDRRKVGVSLAYRY
ncbi:TonB-dependent receptor [Caulobacter hibisci]|uniref:TonB-dependent receptor n=1 Tax=Caulobacter hibisci TaxID=2035993 RepID=A0ABS0STQ1_9CAUL|nr:TonB-dependent receptor [Caulobacter hibisci]MBI1683035.1 TonB-dependent receptor [Caulobacter hibisci]